MNSSPINDELLERDDRKLGETDEFTEVYRLPAGFRVELSDIRGPVEVACHDTDEAEVRVVRRAASYADLVHHRVIVERTATVLVVRGELEAEPYSGRADVTHYIRLRLPRRIALFARRIRGPLNIGEVEGPVSVNSISGPVALDGAAGETILSSVSGSCRIGTTSGRLEVNSLSGSLDIGRLTGALHVSSVSGAVSAVVAALDESGLHLSSISGAVELFFAEEVNADVNIQDVSGRIELELPGVTCTAETALSSVRACVGDGSSPVSISSVSGVVRIRRRI